ncbi:MAG: glutamate--tRNA ligase [Candidatus Berkelbacteria bacterium]|nr:glutamate--tRNA ligase [Candidatus Berkelbacteria bacterium]
MVITRFAPSPTGDPHIGNIRSALFAYLFAKTNSEYGEFLLRIEDTDRARHNEKSVEVIKYALEWLDIYPANLHKPMVQSERLPIYKEVALKLVKEEKAYVCNCSKERLEQVRENQKAKKLPPMYDKHCRNLNLPLEDGCVMRMKIPENRKIELDDLVRGHVEFDSKTIDDQIILKSDGFPTYHLAHVVDDDAMKITHVIRAEEWLSSTPKHILLNEMLGYKTPLYAHLPVILSPAGGKLSKRDGAVGILEYKKMGYLPEALINFMILLGWSPKDESEILIDQDEYALKFNRTAFLPGEFKLEYVNKAPAVFDIKKLNHFNEIFLKNKTVGQLKDLVSDYGNFEVSTSEAELLKRGGFITLVEMADYISKLRQTPEYEPEMLVFKKSTPANTKIGLSAVSTRLSELNSWDETEIQKIFGGVVSENSLSNGDVFWPVRVALSGEEKSPSPIELLLALGKEESNKRIKKALELL